MTQTDPPHRLALIGYWSAPGSPADRRSRGWPDPRELIGEWTADDRRAVVAYLRRGKVFRGFLGFSWCRICGTSLGSGERTDGVWAWPDKLDHYVEQHGTRLPEDFVAAARAPKSPPSWLASVDLEQWLESGLDPAVPLPPAAKIQYLVDDTAWLDWAAANTPAHPAEDAASLDEAREVCRRLSHAEWNAGIDEVNGRWRVRIEDRGQAKRIYLQKCAAAVIERRLLSTR